MERKKEAEKAAPATAVAAEQPEEEREVEFVKTGRGSLRLNRSVYLGSHKSERGKIIKPNQHFWARPSEIPKTFGDVVKPVHALPPEPPLDVVEPGYDMKPNADNENMWDVVDMQGKAMNEQPLTKSDAEELIKALR
jgi:hypothetical protein